MTVPDIWILFVIGILWIIFDSTIGESIRGAWKKRSTRPYKK